MGHHSRAGSEKGVAAVELALLIPVFLLIVFGILEFGYYWYVTHAITNASREGARYGITYKTVPGTTTRQDPRNFTRPSIGEVVDNYLGQFFDIDKKFWTVPTPALALGSGTTIPGAGNNLTVTVTAPYHWLMLQGLVPGMEDFTISISTTMKLE